MIRTPRRNLRAIVSSVAATFAALAGCAQSQPPSAHITDTLLQPNVQLDTFGVHKIKHEYDYLDVRRKYWVLFGPNLTQVTSALGWFVTKPQLPQWVFHVQHSWSLLMGYWPVAETDRVSAGAADMVMVGGTGTPAADYAILVQIEDAAISDVHRVFRLDRCANDVQVHSRWPGTSATDPLYHNVLRDDHTYFEIGTDGKLVGPFRIYDEPTSLPLGPTPVRPFVEYAESVRKAAGL